MADKSKKGTITDHDVSIILERYSPETVLSLLHEVAQVGGESDKIDWKALVKNTATGISSAREYQMLWRHLAYRHTLSDNVDDHEDDEPLDDDSDLEFEVEASPAPSREASVEAAACVKVLMDSEIANDSNISNSATIAAPLFINIPDSSAVGGSRNICIPVCLQKQPVSSGTCGEKRPNSEPSSANMPARRKRRNWSTEEDMKLTAAVKKYGERNWATIAKEDFQNDRKAAELSQRWGNLRKNQSNLKVATSSQRSETELAAAHQAMSLALDTPMGNGLKAARQLNSGTSSVTAAGNSHQKVSAAPPNQKLGTAGPPTIQVPTTIMPQTIPDSSLVKAAAVAAGARIATPEHASSLMEAARSQNALHIKTGISSPAKILVTNQLPSNVHFIRNGLAKAPISTHSTTKPSLSQQHEAQQVPNVFHSTKLAPLQPNTICGSTAQTQEKNLADYSTGSAAVDQLTHLGNPSHERVERHQSSSPAGATEKDMKNLV